MSNNPFILCCRIGSRTLFASYVYNPLAALNRQLADNNLIAAACRVPESVSLAACSSGLCKPFIYTFTQSVVRLLAVAFPVFRMCALSGGVNLSATAFYCCPLRFPIFERRQRVARCLLPRLFMFAPGFSIPTLRRLLSVSYFVLWIFRKNTRTLVYGRFGPIWSNF